MARKQQKRRVRPHEEERFSLRELMSSLSGPIMFFLVIVAVIFVMSVFFRVSDIQVRGIHIIPMKRSSVPLTLRRATTCSFSTGLPP